jgi:trigger factor
VLEEQMVERILEDARVTEVESNYEEAIKPPAREEEAASPEEASAEEHDEDGDSK